MSHLISVIIPCYRQGHFLGDAIRSALDQTYAEKEIIVVNDGSDDNTEEVAKSFGDNIRYIRKSNGGLSSARNAGINIANGDYLHFLDADDLLLPHALSLMMEAMEEKENRIVIVGYKLFERVATEPGQVEFLPPERLEPFPAMINRNFGPPNILLTSRKMILEAGKFQEFPVTCEDWDMWLRLVFQGAEIKTKRTIAVCYRKHEANMSKDLSRMLDSRSQLMKFTHQHFLKNPHLLSSFGNDLLEAENRVLRRWLATGYDNSWIPQIQAMIKELEGEGHQLDRSRIRRLLDNALGIWADKAAINYFRFFKPGKYKSYLQGIN